MKNNGFLQQDKYFKNTLTPIAKEIQKKYAQHSMLQKQVHCL